MASDIYQIRSALYYQESASVYSTPLSINNLVPVLNSPSILFVTGVTLAVTTPGKCPVVSSFRVNFSPTNYVFPFTLAGGGNVMVQLDDPAIVGLNNAGLCLFSVTDGTALAFMMTPVQGALHACRVAGALSAGSPVSMQLFTNVVSGSGVPSTSVAPNTSFGATIYCY